MKLNRIDLACCISLLNKGAANHSYQVLIYPSIPFVYFIMYVYSIEIAEYNLINTISYFLDRKLNHCQPFGHIFILI